MKLSPWQLGVLLYFLIITHFSPTPLLFAEISESCVNSGMPDAGCKGDAVQSDRPAAGFESVADYFIRDEIDLVPGTLRTADVNPAELPNADLTPESPSNAAELHTAEVDMVFFLATGYRVDQLDWNIAGYLGGDYFNVLSELTWKDLEIYQIQLSNQTLINKSIYLRASIGKGEIVNGKNQDSDYNGNNRTQEWLRSNNATDDGSVFDLSIGAGYRFNLLDQKLHIAPLFGFSHHEQKLIITDGNTTVSVKPSGKNIDPPPLGPFDGLHSTYKTNWNGPWIGLDLLYDLNRKFSWFSNSHLALSVEQHWADYSATANWNLIDRFAHPKSFSHHADGQGVVFRADWIADFAERWSMSIGYVYQRWKAESGTDRTYFAWGEVTETRLNEVNWESTAFMLAVGYRF
jgi:hypothetical protein